jgi:hypothetical protein
MVKEPAAIWAPSGPKICTSRTPPSPPTPPEAFSIPVFPATSGCVQRPSRDQSAFILYVIRRSAHTSLQAIITTERGRQPVADNVPTRTSECNWQNGALLGNLRLSQSPLSPASRPFTGPILKDSNGSIATQTFFKPATSPLGGKRAYRGRLGKDRSPSQSRHSIARAK